MRISFVNSNWLNTLSFKPSLFLGIASTSAFATVISAVSKEPINKFKEINDTLSKPLKPAFQNITKGTANLFEKLGDWSKTMANQKNYFVKAINETTKIDSIGDGSKKIFNELKKWVKDLYEILKKIIPKLNDWKNIQNPISKYGNFLKDVLNHSWKSGFVGNELLLKQLFRAAGNENFADFLSATSQLASKNPDLLEKNGGENLENLVQAYNNNPERTTEIIKELSERKDGEVTTESLNNAVKPYALEEKIKQAIEQAQKFISKEKIEEVEKEEAKSALENLKQLLEEVKKTLEKASKVKR